MNLNPAQPWRQPWPAEATTSYPGPQKATSKPKRCRMVKGSQQGSGFRTHMEALLHSRLRLVTMVLLVPGFFFLVRDTLAYVRDEFPYTPGYYGGQAVAIFTVAVLAGLLLTRPCLSVPQLRTLEIVMFGMLLLIFSWGQYELFITQDLMATACGMPHPQMLRLVVVGSSVRWFFLILVYGVFIPNTWRRCALLTSLAGLAPLVLTYASSRLHGFPVKELWPALGEMAGLMITAVVTAVFGSYRLHFLQEQAFEAQQLGQYRLKERLGSGGMGEVYLAEHMLLRRPCAVKLIRSGQAGDPQNVQRFEREVRTMATLTHWNTVEIFDYGHSEDGTFYYVMEYLPGQNLDVLVTRYGPLPPERAIHFLRQVCRALREAHGIGLLHRDIKPSNIIACERGGVYDVAKLLDFGLVQDQGLGKDADRLTLKGTILGSPPYMSPEQAAGKGDLDARSDIYSLGAVAYFLVTGQPPFARETAMQMLLAHAYEAPQPLTAFRPGFPPDLQEVILRCLAKDPAQRFPDVDSLEKALAACQDADAWTEEQARAWWHENRQASAVTEHSLDQVPTRVTTASA